MACDLTTGISLDCREAVGGIETIYINSVTGTSITVPATNGSSASFTFDGTTVDAVGELSTSLYEFQQPRQAALLSEAGTFSEENGTAFYESTLTFVANKLQASTLNTLGILGKNNRLVVVVKDNNGRYFLVGNETGAIVSNSTAETGTAFGDRSGLSIELKGFSKAPMYELNFA